MYFTSFLPHSRSMIPMRDLFMSSPSEGCTVMVLD